MRRFSRSLAASLLAGGGALAAVWLLTRPSVGAGFLFALEATAILAPCAAVALAPRRKRPVALERTGAPRSGALPDATEGAAAASLLPLPPRERLGGRLKRLSSLDGRRVVDAEFLTTGECDLLLVRPASGEPAGLSCDNPGPEDRWASEQWVTGLGPAELTAVCDRANRTSEDGASYRLPTFAEASESPALHTCLATSCRDGDAFSTACPIEMLHAIAVHPYQQIDDALAAVIDTAGTLDTRLSVAGLRFPARRLRESLLRVRELAAALARERARTSGGGENVDLALARALPRQFYPGIARDLPLAFQEAERDALTLLEAARGAGAPVDLLALAVDIAERLGYAAAIDATGDIGRHSTVCTFVRYPPGIDAYAAHVAARLLRHYALALALRLRRQHLPALARFVTALDCDVPAAARCLREIPSSPSEPCASLRLLLFDLLDALRSPLRPGAPAAWARYTTRVIKQLPTQRTSLGADELPEGAGALRVPLTCAGGAVAAWSGVRIVREERTAARLADDHSALIAPPPRRRGGAG